MKPKKTLKEDVQCNCNLRVEKIKGVLIGPQDPIPQENIGDLILNAFKSNPYFVGQVDAEMEELTIFEEMRENSVKCALWLKKVGVKKGDVITICTRNPSVVYMPFLASIFIGAIVNPWEEKYFKDKVRVMYFLVKNEPDVIFIDADNFVELLLIITILKSIKKIIKIVTIGKIKSSITFNSLESILSDIDKAEIDKFCCEKIDMMDTAIRTFSSAAKNYPGQVDVPYIAFTSPSNKQTPVMSSGDVGLWYESLCWTHGPLLTVHSILSQVTAIKSTVVDEIKLYETIQKYQVTWVFLKSDMCNQLFQTDDYISFNYDLFSLKSLLFDNWDMHFKIYKKLPLKLPYVSFIRVYSKPETGVIAFNEDLNILDETDYYSAGYVAKNVQLAFLDNKIKESDREQSYVIYCNTPYQIHCSKHTTKELWHCDGDKAFYTKFQIFYSCNDRDNYIAYKETFLVPGVIEDTLYRHPAVSDVIVTVVKNSIDNEHPRAYVKIKSGAKVTKEQLIEFVAENVKDDYKLRGGVRFITHEIQRLPNGRIYRQLFNFKSN